MRSTGNRWRGALHEPPVRPACAPRLEVPLQTGARIRASCHALQADRCPPTSGIPRGVPGHPSKRSRTGGRHGERTPGTYHEHCTAQATVTAPPGEHKAASPGPRPAIHAPPPRPPPRLGQIRPVTLWISGWPRREGGGSGITVRGGAAPREGPGLLPRWHAATDGPRWPRRPSSE